MSKPDDIPTDVWVAADEALDTMLCNDIEASGSSEQLRTDSVRAIADAIMAERKRCLDLANGWLIAFGEVGAQLKFTTPQEHANNAMTDLADLINSGASVTKE